MSTRVLAVIFMVELEVFSLGFAINQMRDRLSPFKRLSSLTRVYRRQPKSRNSDLTLHEVGRLGGEVEAKSHTSKTCMKL